MSHRFQFYERILTELSTIQTALNILREAIEEEIKNANQKKQ